METKIIITLQISLATRRIKVKAKVTIKIMNNNFSTYKHTTSFQYLFCIKMYHALTLLCKCTSSSKNEMLRLRTHAERA